MARIIRKIHAATRRPTLPSAEDLIYLWPLLSWHRWYVTQVVAGDARSTGPAIRFLSGCGRNNLHSFLCEMGKRAPFISRKGQLELPAHADFTHLPFRPPLIHGADLSDSSSPPPAVPEACLDIWSIPGVTKWGI